MQNAAATTAIILETRTPLKDGRSPVKLRITHVRQARYFSLRNKDGSKIALLGRDYDKVMSPKPRGDSKELALYLNSLEEHARTTIKEMSTFSFELFEKRFFGKHGDNSDLFTCLQNFITSLKKEDRISTYKSYECALNSLKEFTGKSVLLFEKVDIPFLEQYEKWMATNQKSPTTTGIYMRYVRTCFNEAIRGGILRPELYPFGKGKYQIPVGRNIKKALTQNELSLIASYAAAPGMEEQCRDYWLFLFMANGMYLKDMAQLKYKNIQDGAIIFQRTKTRRTLRARPKLIKVIIASQLGRILDRWGNKPSTPEQYIFPILSDGMDQEKQDATARQAIKTINKYVGKIAKEVGIKNKVRTAEARHTHATILRRSGASTEYIAEQLGHMSQQTT